MNLMWHTESDTIFIKHFYGVDIRPDEALVSARERKVAELIKEMGDKYLLATPVKRITQGE